MSIDIETARKVAHLARIKVDDDHLPALAEEFPGLEISRSLYEIDRRRMTCSGGVAALDMMHEIISARHGSVLGAAVCDWLLHTRMREAELPQRMEMRHRTEVSHAGLLKALERMEQSIDAPASNSELAAIAGVSTRHLERLFRRRLY